MVGHPQPDEPLPGDKLDEQLENGLAFGFGEGGERSEIREDTVISTLRKRSGISPQIFLKDIEDDTAPPVNPGTPEVQSAGSRSNRYQIVGEIARGGVGAVLKGRDTDLGRDLAMKVLLQNHAGNPAMVKRFVEEAQVGGQLQHPGIVPVYDLGLQADSRPYFTMKLVQGRTLKALLDARKSLAEDRRRFLTIFEKVVETVVYAHARGVVHRDLKPSNIMVGAYGEVQVMDWGLAKVLARPIEADPTADGSSAATDPSVQTIRTGETEPRSETGSVMGTPVYMPPEQARGEVERIDERSDVFALGAILCVILTGRPPYSGKNPSAVRALAARARLEPAHARLARSDADRN